MVIILNIVNWQSNSLKIPRKMKIVRNWIITFFFLVGRKIWNHFWIVIRPHFIDCNHLKNHQSTLLWILSKWWQFRGVCPCSEILHNLMLRAKNVEVSKNKSAALISKIINFLEDPEYMWPFGITFEKGHFFVLETSLKKLKRKSGQTNLSTFSF